MTAVYRVVLPFYIRVLNGPFFGRDFFDQQSARCFPTSGFGPTYNLAPCWFDGSRIRPAARGSIGTLDLLERYLPPKVLMKMFCLFSAFS